MDKTFTVNQKKANKPAKNKKKQPLKVVYITNPIKFKTSASEFMALVQELTGQDADVSEFSRFGVADGVGGGQDEAGSTKTAAVEGNVHELEGVTKIGQNGNGDLVQKGSDLSTFGSYDDDDDAFYNAQIVESIQGLADSSMWHEDPNLDVFKSLGAM